MKNLFIISYLALSSVLTANSQKSELSPKDLQSLLNITSWKIDYTNKKDSTYKITIEQHTGGKRVSIFEPSGALGHHRNISLALTQKNEDWNTLTIIKGGSLHRQSFPNLTTRLKKQLGEEKAHLIYSVTKVDPKHLQNQDLLYTRKYYLATEHANGQSSNPDKDKFLGETTININYSTHK